MIAPGRIFDPGIGSIVCRGSCVVGRCVRRWRGRPSNPRVKNATRGYPGATPPGHIFDPGLKPQTAHS